MSIPIILQPGQVAIYGLGHECFVPSLGIPNNTNWVYGIVEKVWDGGGVYVYGGDMVQFRKDEARVVTYVNGWPYTIIEARLATLLEPLI